MCTVCVVYIPIRYQYATNTSLIRYFVVSFFERLFFDLLEGDTASLLLSGFSCPDFNVYKSNKKQLSIVKSFSDTLKIKSHYYGTY